MSDGGGIINYLKYSFRDFFAEGGSTLLTPQTQNSYQIIGIKHLKITHIILPLKVRKKYISNWKKESLVILKDPSVTFACIVLVFIKKVSCLVRREMV